MVVGPGRSYFEHFASPGAKSVAISVADTPKKKLHYKNERELPFSTFLTKCEKKFNIYDKYGEPMTDGAKTRFLFANTRCPSTEVPIAALETQQSVGTVIT